MGPIVVPTSGSVYVDANVVIYTVEKHPLYAPHLPRECMEWESFCPTTPPFGMFLV